MDSDISDCDSQVSLEALAATRCSMVDNHVMYTFRMNSPGILPTIALQVWVHVDS